MKFYPYKKACALLVTGALTTGAAVPALAAETKTAAPTTAEESKTKAMTLKEIQELVVKNNRLKTTLTLNQEKVIAGLSAIDDGLKDLKDSQDKAAHARRDAGTSASQGKDLLGGLIAADPTNQSNQILAGISSALLSGAVKTASGMETLVDNVADRQRDTLEDQQTELKNTKMDLNKTKEDWENESLAVTQLLVKPYRSKRVSACSRRSSPFWNVSAKLRKRSRNLALAQAQIFPRKSLPFPRARRSCKVPRTA